MELYKKSDRTVTIALTGLPEGETAAKVYWMVKASLEDADADALLTKTITSVLNSDGQITDIGSGDETGEASIRIADDDLDDLTVGRMYRIGLKVLSSSGDIYACSGYDSKLIVLASGVDAVS
jgi:hypothetical protein